MIHKLLKRKRKYVSDFPPGDPGEFFYTEEDIRMIEVAEQFANAMAGLGFTIQQATEAMQQMFNAWPSVNDIKVVDIFASTNDTLDPKDIARQCSRADLQQKRRHMRQGKNRHIIAGYDMR